MSNSTQNIKEWAGDPMYPRDFTQTDWEKHKVWAKTIANMVYGFNGSDKNNPPMKGLGNATLTLEDCLADARREGHELGRAELVEFEVEKARREVIAGFDEKIEKLAEIEHDQWWKWAKTLMDKETLSKERVERWSKDMIPYKDLPEDVKEYDRKWARKVLATLREEEGV